MDVVPITVFDKAKLKKELFEIVGIAKPQIAFVFPKKRRYFYHGNFFSTALCTLTCVAVDDVKFQNQFFFSIKSTIGK